MKTILLHGIFTLLIYSVAQGLVCNHCDYMDLEYCKDHTRTCKPTFGLCMTTTFYNAETGRLDGVKIGCADHMYDEPQCNTIRLVDTSIFIKKCCTTDRCNKQEAAPFPPPECDRPSLGM